MSLIDLAVEFSGLLSWRTFRRLELAPIRFIEALSFKIAEGL